MTIIIFGKDAHNAGKMVSLFAGFMILFALRNNVLTLLFGMTFDKTIMWHSFTAILVLVLTVVHATKEFIKHGMIVRLHSHKASGLALIAAMIASSLSYFIVKKYKFLFFEVFYYFHIGSFFLAIYLAKIHEADALVISSLFWCLDILIRYVLTKNKVQAEITVLNENVLKITFTKPFNYSAGQFCFISVPALSYYQFHASHLCIFE